MNIFGKWRRQESSNDEALYAMIADEMQSGERNDGLWLKAYAESGGQESATVARYIELRKQSLLDELGKHAATIKGSKKEIAKLKEEASSIFWVSIILYGIVGWV